MNINEKINQSRIFDEYYWNVDNEIENLEETINFHSLSILDNLLKQFLEEFTVQTFSEFKTQNQDIFLNITKNFWNKQQDFYNVFIKEKQEIIYKKMKGMQKDMFYNL